MALMGNYRSGGGTRFVSDSAGRRASVAAGCDTGPVRSGRFDQSFALEYSPGLFEGRGDVADRKA